jgi:hypothetical protein
VAWHLEREHERIARNRGTPPVRYRLAGVAFQGAESAIGLVRGAAGLRP